VVGADGEDLVASHQEPDFTGLAVFEETNVACTAFFPFLGGLVKAKELGTPKLMSRWSSCLHFE
jgi:hypothetical protein